MATHWTIQRGDLITFKNHMRAEIPNVRECKAVCHCSFLAFIMSRPAQNDCPKVFFNIRAKADLYQVQDCWGRLWGESQGLEVNQQFCKGQCCRENRGERRRGLMLLKNVDSVQAKDFSTSKRLV